MSSMVRLPLYTIIWICDDVLADTAVCFSEAEADKIAARWCDDACDNDIISIIKTYKDNHISVINSNILKTVLEPS